MSSSAGRVLMIPKGEYNSSTQYYQLDVVLYNGDSYVAKQNTIGNAPTNTTYWQPMTTAAEDVNSLKETFTKNGAHNLLPLTLANLKANNTGGTWDGNVYVYAGITWTVQADSDNNVTGIAATRTATYSGNSDFYIFTNGDADGLIVNGCPSGGGNNSYYVLTANGSTRTATDYGSGATISGQTDRVICRVVSSYSPSGIVFKPMLRLASDTDGTFAPYAMTNRELTNVVQAEARISAESSAWPGDTLVFKGLPKDNAFWYEFTACVSYESTYDFLKCFIVLRTENVIIVHGKQGDFTVAYNQDGDLVITLPTSAHWLYDMRRSVKLL